MPFGLTSQMGGMCMGPLDICKVPTPVGPIPIPFPNITGTELCDPSSCSMKVFYVGMPAMTLKSGFLLSNGDQAGVGGGVVSGKIMGEVKFVMGSMKVMIEGAPAAMQLGMTIHNGAPPNCPIGSVLMASQFVVMING